MNAVQKFVREPLVHFLVLGGLLFAAHSWLGEPGGAGSTRIVVTPGVAEHLAMGFARTWRRAPDETEMKGLVDEYVKEEIAQREAVALGLDRDDTVIRRRLRQKVEFLLVEEAAVGPPSDAQLQDWMRRNPEAFRMEPRVAFRQVYFRTDTRGASARPAAEAVLAKLESAGPGAEIGRLGDSSMLPGEQPLVPVSDAARTFGEAFAEALAAAPAGRWTGPVASSFGLHVVLVQAREEGATPALERVRPQVEREWMAERRTAQMRALYDRWLAKYEVTIEPPKADPARTASAGAGLVR